MRKAHTGYISESESPMPDLKSKISFTLEFVKPVDAVEECLYSIVRIRSRYTIIEDTDPEKERVRQFDQRTHDEVMVRSIARNYGMVIDSRHGVGIDVKVDGEDAIFYYSTVAAKHPELRVIGSVHFPCGNRFTDVQIGFSSRTQKCVGVTTI